MKQHIHESNLIEGYDDAEFDKQSMLAWEYLIKHDRLSNHIIKQTQYLITCSQDDLKKEWRGKFRKIEVTIGGRMGLHSTFIKGAMDNWLQELPTGSP